MLKSQLLEGDILQISPELDTPTSKRYGGMFLIVTEPKEWGAQGYLSSHFNFDAVRFGENGAAYLRVRFEEVEFCGRVFWIYGEENKRLYDD